jgi:hypothetical protein
MAIGEFKDINIGSQVYLKGIEFFNFNNQN